LVTGLLVGSSLGSGLYFPDLLRNAMWGNIVNFVVGGLVGYMGYQTACNSGLLYRLTYGNVGAYLPVLFLAALTIGWQGIVVGAFGLTWSGSFDSPLFYPIALFAGVLYTLTTLYGVKGLEKVAVPSTVILALVGLYAAWFNVDKAGGWDAFLALSKTAATKKPLSDTDAINIVIGSWVVGGVVMAEYTRFARKAWVAIAIRVRSARGDADFSASHRRDGRHRLRQFRFQRVPHDGGRGGRHHRSRHHESRAVDDR
jgi:cytosine permease